PWAGRGVAERDAPVPGVPVGLQGVRMLEQRFGRDAAPQQARPAERPLFLDDGGFQPELRGANRGHIAAGPGADHNEVILPRHEWVSPVASTTLIVSRTTTGRTPSCRPEALSQGR